METTRSTPDGQLPPGFDGPRACGPYDLAPMLDMINLVFRTQAANGPPRAPSMGWDYSHIYNPHNLDNVRVVCHGVRPVSSVGIHATQVATPRGSIAIGGINAVGTHPDYRRLGLATLTMEDAAAQMRHTGMQVGLLSTGISNWYRKLGWERAGQQRTFTFDRRNIGALPELNGLDVSPDWAAHLDELCALRRASGVGAVRTPELFAVLAARKVGHLFTARRGAEVTAYVAVSGGTVREYAGRPEDVLALVRHAFGVVETLPAHSTDRRGAQQGQFELSVLTPAFGAGVPSLLQDLGVPAALGYMGMLLILDAPGLFDALGVQARVERREDGWRVTHGGWALDLTDGELVKLIFGPERRPDVPAGLFPVDCFQWPMDRV